MDTGGAKVSLSDKTGHVSSFFFFFLHDRQTYTGENTETKTKMNFAPPPRSGGGEHIFSFVVVVVVVVFFFSFFFFETKSFRGGGDTRAGS